jgi:hypothetical protein
LQEKAFSGRVSPSLFCSEREATMFLILPDSGVIKVTTSLRHSGGYVVS